MERLLTFRTDWDELLQKVESGDIDPTIMVTHRLSIEDIAKAYYMQEQRKGGLLKCFVQTRFSEPRAEGTPELEKL